MKSIPRWLVSVLQVAAFLFSIIALTVVMVRYIERPVVYKSWSTQKCVKVEVAPKHKPLTCEEVLSGTEPYALEWVK